MNVLAFLKADFEQLAGDRAISPRPWNRPCTLPMARTSTGTVLRTTLPP